jgi:branched-chain amino acid transport system ATP-binding protein
MPGRSARIGRVTASFEHAMTLVLEKLSKTFGSIVVADAIDLEVPDGEALGIIGPNGAGKSTLFNLITGVVRPQSGSISLDGRSITKDSPRLRCIKGIARAFQIPHPFEGLTVFENLLVAASFGRSREDRRTERLLAADCAQVLEETGLIRQANRLAGSLNLLQRKRLEMARALATKPRLLLLDEIAGGLTDGECAELVAMIKNLRRSGITIIWIEHIVHALNAVVDRLIVLNFGRKISEGEPRAVMNSALVREIYMGIEA